MYEGENFLEKDWDNLIILDACRPDFFEKHNPFSGKVLRKISLGASSSEFFIKNFNNKKYHDTVYVTGNPKIETIDEKSVHRIIRTYADNFDHHKGWLPETIAEAALEAYNEYPNKRLVVHFMQPHAPYLGKRADELRERVTDKYNIGFGHMESMGKEQYQLIDDQVAHLLLAFEQGYISRNELEEVYVENLRLVFEYVEQLIENIDGKTVISADHAESFGDFGRIYGHKEYALSRRLREVPWLTINGNRRRTFSEPPIESTSVDEDVVRENLRDLGYI